MHMNCCQLRVSLTSNTIVKLQCFITGAVVQTNVPLAYACLALFFKVF